MTLKKIATKNKTAGRPASTLKDNKTVRSVEQGTKPGERRKTYIVNTELSEKIDAIAYWERLSLKDVVHDAFTDKVAKYEKKNGTLKNM